MNTKLLTVRINQVNAEGATLEINGQQVQWPLEALPAGMAAGDTVYLKLLTDADEAMERAERARAILAEILGSRP